MTSLAVRDRHAELELRFAAEALFAGLAPGVTGEAHREQPRVDALVHDGRGDLGVGELSLAGERQLDEALAACHRRTRRGKRIV